MTMIEIKIDEDYLETIFYFIDKAIEQSNDIGEIEYYIAIKHELETSLSVFWEKETDKIIKEKMSKSKQVNDKMYG